MPETLSHMQKFMKPLIPQGDVSKIVSLCKLLESFMDKQEVKGLEYLFIFCAIWAIGAGYAEKDAKDYF
jgi:hypothetical protein